MDLAYFTSDVEEMALYSVEYLLHLLNMGFFFGQGID